MQFNLKFSFTAGVLIKSKKTKTKIYSVDLEICELGIRKITTIKMQICGCKAPRERAGVLRISLMEKFVVNSIYWVP